MSIRVKISGKLYAKAFQEGWLPALALYVYLNKSRHGNKVFYFKRNQKTKALSKLAAELNISLTQFSKNLKILQQKGMVTFSENSLRLITKKEMQFKMQFVFVPADISSLKDIKTFLKAIPLLSNLYKQSRKIDKIKRYSYIRRRSFVRGGITRYERSALKAYTKKGGKMNHNSTMFLSVQKLKGILRMKTKSTVIKHKKFLRDQGIIRYWNERLLIDERKYSFREFILMKWVGSVPDHSFWSKGYIYTNKPSAFSLPQLTSS